MKVDNSLISVKFFKILYSLIVCSVTERIGSIWHILHLFMAEDCLQSNKMRQRQFSWPASVAYW